MAYQSGQDAINQPQSMDASPSIDVSAKDITSHRASDGKQEGVEKPNVADTESSDQTSWSISEIKNINSTDVNEPLMKGEDLSNTSTFNLAIQEQSLKPSASIRSKTTESILENRESDNEQAVDDSSYQHGNVVDPTGGSDTDTSKADSVEQSKEGNLLHIRSNSIKKPTSFKAVSVTKNYLAKTGAGAVAAAKASGEKAPLTSHLGSLSQQSAKPRLVAKFGRDSRSSPVGNGLSSAAPDASKVWNKNRPASQPPQRQMTDEELKQHYGIHLATRIQADEVGKDSKWADIDDDEDNWAPETVEWIDGTKSAVLSTENQPAALEKYPGASNKVDESHEISKSAINEAQRPPSLGPGKTILRPGAHALGAQMKPGLVLRSVPENNSVLAKPSTPSTSKSPWAQLPPVDRSSPVFINPPTQPSPQQALGPRDPQDFDSNMSVQSTAKEIAADDFDRTWKESDRSNVRELFNSQSGRYEPVKDRRRPSLRNEGAFRQPSVLQRPSQSNGPAEPSPAFQTRRRTSSSVSDRNGIFAQPLPMDRMDESAIHSETLSARGTSPSTTQPTSQSQSPILQQRYTVKPSDMKRTHSGVPDPVLEDPVAVQNRLMRERIELNRKRKQEEEAKEEAARKERIRLKMESLGPAPSTIQESRPAEASTTEPDGKVVGPVSNRSPPKPSTTESISEAQSQILQKISHQPAKDRAKLSTATTEPQKASPAVSTKTFADPMQRMATGPSRDIKPAQGLQSRSDEDIPRIIQTDVDRMIMTDLPHDSAFEVKVKPHQFKPTPPSADTSGGWPNNSIASHPANNRNVWGPPTNDRSLGNGVFERDFHRLPSMQLPLQHQMLHQQSVPGPIGPPSPSPRIPFEAAQIVSSASPSPAFDQPQPGAGAATTASQRYASSPMTNMMNISQMEQSSSMSRAPFGGSVDNFYRHGNPQVSAARSAWQNLPAQLKHDEAEAASRSRREQAVRIADEQRSGIKDEYQPFIKEVFRQTSSDGAGHRKKTFMSETVHGGAAEWREGSALSNQQHHTSVSMPPYGNAGIRGSRFFSTTADGPPNSIDSLYMQPENLLAGDGTIPPPDDVDHPAFSSSAQQKLVVKLPEAPKVPIVKLPPTNIASASSPEPTVTSPMRIGSTFRAGAQPLVTQTAWQSRFNGLFNRKPPLQSSETATSPSLTVNSATKAPLDVSPFQSSATVALPQGHESHPNLADYGNNTLDAAVSKPSDSVLFDEPVFGSSPTVHVTPSDAAVEHYRNLRNPVNDITKIPAAVEPTSYQPLAFLHLESDKVVSGGIHISVQLPQHQRISLFLAKRLGMVSNQTSSGSRKSSKPRLRVQSLSMQSGLSGVETRSNTLPRSSKRPARPQNNGNPPAPDPSKSAARHAGSRAPSVQQAAKGATRIADPSPISATAIVKDTTLPRPAEEPNTRNSKWGRPLQGKNSYRKKEVGM